MLEKLSFLFLIHIKTKKLTHEFVKMWTIFMWSVLNRDAEIAFSLHTGWSNYSWFYNFWNIGEKWYKKKILQCSQDNRKNLSNLILKTMRQLSHIEIQ